MYSVTVLTPRGYRQQVKVTPNTTLLQVLEEVCLKHGLNPKEYDLRHHNKVLDVSSILRFTSLPNNAQLEMTEASKQRQESPVTLGLQLESGERLTGVFIPSDTVWHVVSTLKPEETKSSDVVVIYMRREMYGKDTLSSTTLRSLGLTSGRAILRLLHKSPEELRKQANVTAILPRVNAAEVAKPTREQQQQSKSPEPGRKEAPVPPGKRDEKMGKNPSPEPKRESAPRQSTAENLTFKGNVFENLIKQEKAKRAQADAGVERSSEEQGKVSRDGELKKKAMESKAGKKKKESEERKPLDREWIKHELEKKKEENKVTLLGDRSALAYSLNSVVPVEYEDEPDTFYDLTVNEARMLMKQAKELRVELENAPLMTSAQRELERDKKTLSLLHQYKKTVLRVNFPDRMVLQGTFSPIETVADVEKFVANYLHDPKIKFYLYTTPPKTVLKSSERLIECGCVPSCVLYFGIDSRATVPSQYLKAEVMLKLSTPSAAALQAYESRGVERKFPEEQFEEQEKKKSLKKESRREQQGASSSVSREPPPVRDNSSAYSSQNKFPKWFKPNK